MSSEAQLLDSILLTVKKMLGLDAEYKVFDPEIITYVNGAFGTLHQIGVGPKTQFFILNEDDVWGDFLTAGEDVAEVRSYIYIRVRLLFDPPSSSFVLSSLQEQAKELEWRLNVKADELKGV